MAFWFGQRRAATVLSSLAPLALGLWTCVSACSHGSRLDRLREARTQAQRQGESLDASQPPEAGRDAGTDSGVMKPRPEPDVDAAKPESEAACVIVDPPAGGLLAADDLDPGTDDLQIEVVVETDGAGADAPIRLEVDGEEVASADPEDLGDGRYGVRVSLGLGEGEHEIAAQCGSGAQGTHAEPVGVTVDTRPCMPAIVAPESGVQVTVFDDEQADVDGLQISVSGELTGDDCAGAAAYECGVSESERNPVRSSGEGPFEQEVTLRGQGATEICLTARDDSGNVETVRLSVERLVCAPQEVLCGIDRACHADTDRNPDFCGDDCLSCPGPAVGRGSGACINGECALACADGYVLLGEACVPRPSCKGLASTCAGDSCCAVDAVSESGDEPLKVQRGYDQSGKSTGIVGWATEDENLAVTVDDFELDRYEVTVGRFRTFLNSYEGWLGGAAQINPRPGQGHHRSVPASGWQASWPGAVYTDATLSVQLTVLPVDRADFVRRISSCTPATWTNEPSEQEDLPINCVTFHEAFLFCLFEGGRLPTEAEWIVAAAGGRQQRAYPWSQPPSDDEVSLMRAAYDGPETEGPLPVGTRPAGVGRWGTHDLGGNVYEWTRDAVLRADQEAYAPASSNPIELSNDGSLSPLRAVRGGSYKFGPDYMRTTYRQWAGGTARINDVGFRCAYPANNQD